MNKELGSYGIVEDKASLMRILLLIFVE